MLLQSRLHPVFDIYSISTSAAHFLKQNTQLWKCLNKISSLKTNFLSYLRQIICNTSDQSFWFCFDPCPTKCRYSTNKKKEDGSFYIPNDHTKEVCQKIVSNYKLKPSLHLTELIVLTSTTSVDIWFVKVLMAVEESCWLTVFTNLGSMTLLH